MRKFIPDFAKTIPPEAQRVFAGEIWDVYQWPQKMFDGSTATFEMLDRPDTVKIIAVKDDKIVITYQRQPNEDWFYDFPGGRHDDPDENELDAAKRELREETGMEFKTWRLIGVEQPFIKINWLVYTFLATDFISKGEQVLDAGEEIEVKEVGFDEMLKLGASKESRYLRISAEKEYKSLDELLGAEELYKY